MQPLDGAHQLVVQRLLVVEEVVEVLVAREDLVSPLAGKHHLHVLGRELREYVVGHCASDKSRVERLYGADHLRQHPHRVLGGVDALVVLGFQILRDSARRQKVRRVFETDGEGLELQASLAAPLGGDGGDEAGVEPAGEEHSDRHVAHHLALYGLYESFADGGEDVLWDLGAGLGRGVEALQLAHVVGDGGGELHQTFPGGPVVSGREDLDLGLPVGVEGAKLGGEDGGAVLLRPEQRLDADRVAGGDEASVLAGDDEGEHALEAVDLFWSQLVHELQGDLVVRAGDENRAGDLGAHLVVVVDLAVADEVSILPLVHERLPSAADVHDREPAVPEPATSDADLAFGVRAPVDDPPEHP